MVYGDKTFSNSGGNKVNMDGLMQGLWNVVALLSGNYFIFFVSVF